MEDAKRAYYAGTGDWSAAQEYAKEAALAHHALAKLVARRMGIRPRYIDPASLLR